MTLKRLRGPATFLRKQRLLEEVQLAFRLHHPAIAQVHHLTVHRGVPYVIMEHVDGPSLQTVISLAAMRGQPVPVPFALYVAAEVADALHHAHTLTDDGGQPLRLIHRDVSPRNIRLCQRTGAVKVAEVARLLAEATVLRDKVELTEDFLPPGLEAHELTPGSGESRP